MKPATPSIAGQSRPGPRPLLICLGLFAVTLAVYWPVTGYDFAGFDDGDYVVDNPIVNAGLTWSGFKWAFAAHASNWHPLTWLSHMLDCQLYGLKAGGHHLTNVLFHALNTLLLFGLLQRLTRVLWRSALVAALFALHPLHVESVAWIAERKDVLSAFFFFLTLWAYARYAEAKAEPTKQISAFSFPFPGATKQGGGGSAFYWLALLFFTLGLMSKQMLVTVPFVLLLLDYWPLRRLQRFSISAFQLFLEKLPFFVLSFAAGLLTIYAQHQGGAIRSLVRLPLHMRVENALLAYVHYLHQMFWPRDLAVYYPYPDSISLLAVGGAALVLLLVSMAVVLKRRQCPYLAIGWCWYVIMLLPVVGIIQVGSQAHADRYTYLPLIGIFVALAWLAADWKAGRVTSCAPGRGQQPDGAHGVTRPTNIRKGEGKRSVLGATSIIAILLVLACCIGTRLQLRHWRDVKTLFTRAVAVAPSAMAYNNLGVATADPREKLQLYNTALRLMPDFDLARRNLGELLLKEGKIDEAVTHLKEAVRLLPKDASTRTSLGRALLQQGRPDEAVEHFEAALNLDPNYAEAHAQLGSALLARGQLDAAREHFNLALKSSPAAETLNNIGDALFKSGQAAEAIEFYSRAARLAPDRFEPENNLGNAHARLGRNDEAMLHYNQALRINPRAPEVHNGIGILMATQNRQSEAVARFEEALRLKPDYRDARVNLGHVWFQQGKMEEAAACYAAAFGVVSADEIGLALFQKGRLTEAASFFERALRHGSNAPLSHYRLATVLVRQEKPAEAISQYREALRANPDLLEALNDLAWLLATHSDARYRDGREAVELAARAVTLTRTNEPSALDTLAAAHAEAGQFNAAIQTAELAISTARNQGHNQMLPDLQKHLGLYRSGQPLRQ